MAALKELYNELVFEEGSAASAHPAATLPKEVARQLAEKGKEKGAEKGAEKGKESVAEAGEGGRGGDGETGGEMENVQRKIKVPWYASLPF